MRGNSAISKQPLLPSAAHRELRNAFGTFPTGVTVATCRNSDGSLVGVTLNSFVSLSISPPLISVALHSSARHLLAFRDSDVFAVNVLRADQKELSFLFARPSECSWQSVSHQVALSGHIVLDDIAASFLCRLRSHHEVGDHVLLVGEVESFSYDVCAEPMAFLRGRYGSFREAASTTPGDLFESPATPSLGWG